MVGSVIPALLVASALAAGSGSGLVRRDHIVAGEPGIRLSVREIEPRSAGRRPALLLVHGARVPGIASFDLDAPGGSLAADLARRGLSVYVLDVRGYGGSTRPPAMSEPPERHTPLVRAPEAARDIGAVVDWIRRRRGVPRVALLGWATGGMWAGFFASQRPGEIGALILLNSLYGGSPTHPSLGPGSDLADPGQPGRFNDAACGAWRLTDGSSLLRAWDRGIPGPDKERWRDPAVARAFTEAALASDPTSATRTPASFRSPCGAFEDSFIVASGRQLWDASLVTAPTLVLASEHDFWSRPADRDLLAAHLTRAARVRVVVLPEATHFVHLERPEVGRALLVEEVMRLVSPRAERARPLAEVLSESRRLTLAGEWDEALRRLAEEASTRGSEARKRERLALQVERARVLADRSFFHRKDPTTARRALEGVLPQARSLGLEDLAGEAVQLLGQLDYGEAFETGDWETPRTAFLEAARVSERSGDLAGQARSTFYVGLTYEQAGQPEPAMQRYVASLALAERAGDAVQQSYAHRHIGGLHEEKGELDAAERHIARSLALRREARFRVGVPFALLQLADFRASHRGDDAGAERLREEAAREASASGSTQALSTAHRALAITALAAGRAADALAHAEKARAAAEAYGDPSGMKAVRELLGKL